jgi:hypothetical protein
VPLSRLDTWTSDDLGVRLAYPTRVFSVEADGAHSLRLGVRTRYAGERTVSLWLSVSDSRDAPAEQLLAERVSDLDDTILGLAPDQEPRTVVSAPRIGSFTGVGGSYRGTADTPQGPAVPVIATLAAATDGRVGVVVSYVISGTDEPAEIARLRVFLSVVLQTVNWSR